MVEESLFAGGRRTDTENRETQKERESSSPTVRSEQQEKALVPYSQA